MITFTQTTFEKLERTVSIDLEAIGEGGSNDGDPANGVSGTITYEIVDEGRDEAVFFVDDYSGGLRFVVPVDYEMPIDSNRDNTYQVMVRATDSANGDVAEQLITITVGDKPYDPVISSPVTDTLTVQSGQTFVTNIETRDDPNALDGGAVESDGISYFIVGPLSMHSISTLMSTTESWSLSRRRMRRTRKMKITTTSMT